MPAGKATAARARAVRSGCLCMHISLSHERRRLPGAPPGRRDGTRNDTRTGEGRIADIQWQAICLINGASADPQRNCAYYPWISCAYAKPRTALCRAAAGID